MDRQKGDSLLEISKTINKIDLPKVVDHLSVEYRISNKRFQHYEQEEMIDFCNRYVNAIEKLLKTSGRYNVKTALYDDLEGITENNTNYCCSDSNYDFFDVSSRKILEMATATENDETSCIILEMLNDFSFLWEKNDVENVLVRLLMNVSERNIEHVFSFKNLFEAYVTLYIPFICKILTECERKDVRQVAFKQIETLSTTNSDEFSRLKNTISKEHFEILELERKIKSDENVLQTCLNHVNEKNLLTITCFEKLSSRMEKPKTREIVKKIVQTKQEIPNFFIEEFKTYCTNSAPETLAVLGISKSLIKGKYINLADVSCFKRLMDSKDFVQKTLDLIEESITAKICVPDEIVEKLESLSNDYKRAARISNLIRRIYGSEKLTDKLINGRVDLIEKKKILDEIVSNKKNHNQKTVKALEVVIQFEENLRYDAFKTLIKILPPDYSSQIPSFNLKSVMKYMHNVPIDKSDMIMLIEKDKSIELLPFLEFVMHNANTDVHAPETLLHFLREIFSTERGQKTIVECSMKVLKFIRCVTNAGLRDEIIEIVVDSINAEDSLEHYSIDNRLIQEICQAPTEDSISISYLAKIEFLVLEGYAVPTYISSELISSLTKKNLQKHHKYIAKILYTMSQKQGLEEKANTFFNIVGNNLELLESEHFVNLLKISIMNSEQHISEEAIQKFISQIPNGLNEKAIRLNLIKVAILVLERQELPNDLLKKLSQIVQENIEDACLNVSIVELFSKVIERTTNFADIPEFIIPCLQKVAINSNLDDNDYSYLLNSTAFSRLQRSFQENAVPSDFTKTYYSTLKDHLILKKMLKSSEGVEEALDSYIENASIPDLSKFRLLNALNCMLSTGLERCVNNIFTTFCDTDWLPKILQSILLASACKNPFKTQKIVIQNFLDNLNQLQMMLKVRSSKYTVEDVLQILVQKQQLYLFDIDVINDIILMISSFEEVADVLFTVSGLFLENLKETWVVQKLSIFGIDITNIVKNETKCFFKYQIAILDIFFSRMKEGISFSEIVHFFKMLDDSTLSTKEKEHFLASEIGNEMSVAEWKFKLEERLIQIYFE